MLASGFKDAPVSQFILLSIVASSIAASVTDTQYLFYIQVVPHLWQYGQFWRIFSWQMCFTNSTEVLFAAMTVYHMRVVERLWGSRKFASFLLSTLPYTMLFPPMLLALVLRPLSFGALNYLPAGPTAILFALLAQYHATVPQIYKYRVATSSSQDRTRPPPGLLFSDKSTTYLVAGQLALSQFPGSLLSALVGWVVGKAWRRELLPGGSWRVPGWLLMEKTEGDRYEGLRRRLEGETAASGSSSAIDGSNTNAQRRTVGSQIFDQFRNL